MASDGIQLDALISFLQSNSYQNTDVTEIPLACAIQKSYGFFEIQNGNAGFSGEHVIHYRIRSIRIYICLYISIALFVKMSGMTTSILDSVSLELSRHRRLGPIVFDETAIIPAV